MASVEIKKTTEVLFEQVPPLSLISLCLSLPHTPATHTHGAHDFSAFHIIPSFQMSFSLLTIKVIRLFIGYRWLAVFWADANVQLA